MDQAETIEPVMEQTEVITKTESAKWQDGWVKHNGEVYAYKEDLMSFLIMGIDKTSITETDPEALDGGNADVLMLFVMDPVKKHIDFIPINRNTMVDVNVYDKEGDVLSSNLAQIAVQHGVGSGLEDSCEYEVRAVSNLFYQLPIHGYAAMTMDGIVPLCDAIGGVDVVVPEDYDAGSIKFTKGETVHLEDEEAYLFVRSRDTEVGGADRRLERQQVYLEALIDKIYETIKNDPLSFMSIYNSVSDYTVTSISGSKLIYLATEAAGYEYDNDSVHEIPGATTQGNVSDEFYVDDDKFRDMVIDIFYEKVDD